MKYCQNCLQPNTRPGTVFQESTCPACIFILNSQKWDWQQRVQVLRETLSKLTANTAGTYDSILGISGGKDSTRLALWARDYLGLRPLLVSVTYPPEQMTKRGADNLNNLSELGFDIYSSSPSPILWKELMKKGFLESGNWAKSTELALFAGVPQIAIQLGINVILWGENPGLQLGALETLGKTGWDGNQLRKMNTLSGMSREWFSVPGSMENGFLAYQYPTEMQFLENGIQIVFLGWAMQNWGLLENGLAASLEGLAGRIDSASNTSDLIGLTSVDEDWVTLNQMIKFYKYGFGRATDYVNEWIRKGMISRDSAIEIVNKYDGVCSDEYIRTFCHFIDIEVGEFWEIVAGFTNLDLFELKKGKRPAKKFTVGQDLT
jgi:N-acetyl sugar amidotransferase